MSEEILTNVFQTALVLFTLITILVKALDDPSDWIKAIVLICWVAAGCTTFITAIQLIWI
jgi:hypothetical protein